MPFDFGEKKQKPVRSVSGLLEAGLARPEEARDLETLAQDYAIGLSSHVLETIRERENPALDPVGRQYIPSMEERDTRPEERADPIGDAAHSPVEGIVHRYPDRVLLKITALCAVYCRFCFRREMVGPGKAAHLSPQALDQAFAYIESRPEIREVILTGGDPLVLSSRRLETVLKKLDSIKHVQMIRIHSRVPVADPSRINNTISTVFKKTSKPLYLVIHVNHPQELTPDVDKSLALLRVSGCTLLSQSVLLKGVNNDTETLENLFRALVSRNVKPYYLHHPDLAKGTAHFRVSIEEGQDLMRSLRGRISGIALPTYVLDIPGGYGKIPVEAPYLEKRETGGYRVRDYRGLSHLYPPPEE